MASSGPAKGEAIALNSLFSAEETAKAARRVQEVAAERGRDLDRLSGFAADNSALVSLVRRLPDEVSHDIMVPFGGVAFFPGRLIHTNEFLVLLGEGYYAERSSKQTVEILKRRGESIETQIKSLKVSISDLEAEAQYFSSTASEVAEGLVEIREEYNDDSEELGSSSITVHNEGKEKREKDGEYNRVMEILEKLEKEELEAGSDDSDDDDSDEVEPPVSSEDEGSDEEEEDREDEDSGSHKTIIDLSKPMKALEIKDSASTSLVVSHESISEKKTTKRVSFKIPEEQPRSIQEPAPRSEDNVEESRSHNATIGSIVERDHNHAPIQPPNNISSHQATSSKPSRPVSRFKLQKGGR